MCSPGDSRSQSTARTRFPLLARIHATFASAKVLVYDVSVTGVRTESGSALIDRQLLPWQRLPGNLIGLADKEVESALNSNGMIWNKVMGSSHHPMTCRE